MTLAKFKARNHPQQIARDGVLDEVDDRGTPQEFFDRLNETYKFTLDVAAASHNAKTAAYFTRADNGLVQPWTGSVWCNPPYSAIGDWLQKAWLEWNRPPSDFDEVRRIVMLLPANRTEQRWWQDYVEPYRDQSDSDLEVQFISGRLRFIRSGEIEVKPNDRPPFGCCLLVWER